MTETDGCGRMMKIKTGEGQQMKPNKSFLVLAITWLLVSLVHFCSRNILMGITWLCVAIVQLIVAFVSKDKKE